MRWLFGQAGSFFKPSLPILSLAMFCMVINALATGFYAYLIGPVVKFLFAGGLLENDSLTSLLRFIGLAPRIGDRDYLLLMLPVLILLAAIVKGAAQFGKSFLMGQLGERAVFSLRSELLRKVHHLPDERFDTITGGDFVTRLGSDVSMIQEALTQALSALISDSLKILVLLAVAVFLDWRLAMISVCVLPMVPVPIVLVGRRLKQTAGEVQKSRAEMSAHVMEDVAGARVIKDYRLEAMRLEKFSEHNRNYLLAAIRAFFVKSFSSPLMELLGALGLAATLWLAGSRMASGALVPEHFISFFAAILMLYEPMKSLGRINNVIQSGRAGAARVFEILNFEEEEKGGEERPETFREEIRFDGVKLSLGGREILHGIDFSLGAGKMTAFVGASGAGKSTLMKLLLRHYTHLEGRILIDGIALEEIDLSALRNLITVVEQRPHLFNDSLIYNVQLGAPEAGRKEVMKAIEMARLTELIERLPKGLDTPVGENGMLLSEGEKQRVALARAFLKNSPIVIFDEVTAALDAASETAIREAILDLAQKHTVLVIAHRLSTIRDAEHIIVLEEGRIVEQGSHSDLISKKGTYRSFIDMQSCR